MFEPENLIEVRGRGDGVGYHLGNGFVLTAAAIVADSDVAVRFSRSRLLAPARVVWASNHHGVGLVRVMDVGVPDGPVIDWGAALPGAQESLPCKVYWFTGPAEQRGDQQNFSTRLQLGQRGGLGVIRAPLDTSFDGALGAPVFSGTYFVGIVIDSSREGLRVASLGELLSDEGFRDALAESQVDIRRLVVLGQGGEPVNFDVFVAYNQRDLAVARLVDQALRRAGLTVFLAARLLPAEGVVDRVLFAALRQSRCFAVLLGSGPNGPFVVNEISFAAEASDILVVPVVIGSEPIDRRFRGVRRVDLRGASDEVHMTERMGWVIERLGGPQSTQPSGQIGIWGYRDGPADDDFLERTPLIEALYEMLSVAGKPNIEAASQSGANNPGGVEAGTGKSNATQADSVLANLAARSDRRRSENNENLGPTVVALEGPWGTGKTTIMRLVGNRLRGGPAPIGEREVLPPDTVAPAKRPWRLRAWQADLALSGWAWPRRRLFAPTMLPRAGVRRQLQAQFEPWSYQSGEQVWAGLASQLLAAAQPVIEVSDNVRERYWFQTNIKRLDVAELQRAICRRSGPVHGQDNGRSI
jgi:hypothetical protein